MKRHTYKVYFICCQIIILICNTPCNLCVRSFSCTLQVYWTFVQTISNQVTSKMFISCSPKLTKMETNDSHCVDYLIKFFYKLTSNNIWLRILSSTTRLLYPTTKNQTLRRIWHQCHKKIVKETDSLTHTCSPDSNSSPVVRYWYPCIIHPMWSAFEARTRWNTMVFFMPIVCGFYLLGMYLII